MAGYAAPVMDDYEHLDLAGSDFVPAEHTTEWLAVLSLEEAHDLLALLSFAREEGPMSEEADRLAREIAARIPSEN
ncbi:hypothetical protein GCM10010129_02770 [Streptomyces fumigatiscleroticus]|nr:hypothetical protein GCM10010129_02770 [Streptomyces fumigatiscleroticus]